MNIRVSNGQNMWTEASVSRKTLRAIADYASFGAANGDHSHVVCNELSLVSKMFDSIANTTKSED